MTPVSHLALATTAFVGTHLLLSHPFRKSLVRRVGEKGFLGLYSLAALATFGWMIGARLGISSDPVWWVAPPWFWDVATLLMLFASVLLAGSLRGNPAAVNPKGRIDLPDRPHGVYAITRHPMMWAFIIWALVHMALWGSTANLILSGGILALALFGSLGQDSKKKRLMGPDWVWWQRQTAYVPFAGQLAGRLRWRDALPGWAAFSAGLVIWLAATWAHLPAGGPAAGIWRWIG